MEGSSEGEKKPPMEPTKIRRKMKTASELEILEKAYTVETYPSEALRAELSVKLGLSDRQLQMWFCHRRLKDRKAPSVKRPRKSSPAMAAAAVVNPVGGSGEENENTSGLGMGSNVYAHPVDRQLAGQRPGVAIARIDVNLPSMKRFYESQQSIAELRAIALVEAQLGEPLREDGPILGMEFDPLPPGAFGAPIGATTISDEKKTGQFFEVGAYKQGDAEQIVHHQMSGRTLHEYQFLPAQPTAKSDKHERGASFYQYGSHANVQNFSRTPSMASGHSFLHGHEQVSSRYCSQGPMSNLNIFAQQSRRNHLLLSSMGEHDNSLCKSSLVNSSMDPQYGTHPTTHPEYTSMLSDQRIVHGNNVLWSEKKHENDEARIAQEVEAHEKKMRKELEKQDALRRKREEQIRKDMERHDRERQREEERLSREKQKEEERHLREQRREALRREKLLQKESIRAERIRQKEALRREREAARLKAANQRAIARRMAKESMELAEDERLELMELAVSSKGLPSIMSLDRETLENLKLFEDMRPTFPPESVQMKRPFSNHPWTDSEANVGNLLMVWKFLVTFADVLGLWPFTLDEFVQAFHDHDSRLLGEVHIGLLKCIIKDIEDVAKTLSTGLGFNQNSSANPGGGHLQTVDGAYAWGFDIRSWQHHLNPLTWPEILRQLALSAGFGPQLGKGGNAEPANLHDENEGTDVGDIVTNLRNGLAAKKAVVIMQERGFSNKRRSRHRLTPGTVKFAAFHVLSLEGSKGLNIVEVADKIQKFGLRDLTTSRMPEASIAAALSRDSKLFERTAPSTYCVRSPYRKDPGDADVILSTARKRIRIFKSGSLDGEDAERDDDSEADVTEVPEVEDLGTEGNAMKEHRSPDVCPFDEMTSIASGKGSNEVRDGLKVGMENGGPCQSILDLLGRVKGEESPPVEQPIYTTGTCTGQNQEDSISDEGDHGEPWVQGLTEGEYSDLSVEERLNALCSLIGVALEGNSMRSVLEERLEAANSLKKQMLAEAQLDKRRVREEYVMQIHEALNLGNKAELKTISSMDARHSPIPYIGEGNSEGPLGTGFQQEDYRNSRNNSHPLNDFPSEGHLQVQDIPVEADSSQFQQSVLAIEKSRSRLKLYIGRKAEEMYVYRSLPLGQDRRCNRYWQFTSSASRNEPGNDRIFVELHNGSWRLIDSVEGFDALLASLDVRGIRESHLHLMLQKLEKSFKAAIGGNILQDSQRTGEGAAGHHYNAHTNGPNSTVYADDSDMFDSSTSFRIEPEESGSDKTESLKRYHDFESWMRSECFSLSIFSAEKYGKKQGQLLGICNRCQCFYFNFENSNHCRSCHQTRYIPDLYFSGHMAQRIENISISWCSTSPLRIRLLKMLLTLIEVSIPVEAFQTSWTDFQRKTWGSKLLSSSSAEDLLQILTLLESGIKPDFMGSNYETTYELLACVNPPGSSICHSSSPETVPVLPWIPLTTAAVALRLLEFDASLSYILQQKAESQDQGSEDIKPLSNYAAVKNNQNSVTAVIPNECVKEATSIDRGVGLSSSDHGQLDCKRGYQIRGGKTQKRSNGSRAISGKRSTGTNRKILRQALMWKDGQVDEQGEFRRGRRSVRSRQKSARKIKFGSEGGHPEETIHEHLKLSLDNNREWNDDDQNTRVLQQNDESLSSSDRLHSIDDNGVEYDDVLVDDCARSQRADYQLASRSYDMDEDKEDDLSDDGERSNIMEDGRGDLYVEQYMNGEYNEESSRNLENNMVSEEEIQPASSDYSD